MADRDSLKDRELPFMTLSDGSASSMTGPPPPLPLYLNAEGRALARFAVEVIWHLLHVGNLLLLITTHRALGQYCGYVKHHRAIYQHILTFRSHRRSRYTGDVRSP